MYINKYIETGSQVTILWEGEIRKGEYTGIGAITGMHYVSFYDGRVGRYPLDYFQFKNRSKK
jgi:hypothetical protein